MAVLLGAVAYAGDAKTVVVTSIDGGKTIQVGKGGVLEVHLELQGGTGYTWQASSVPGKLLRQQATSVTEPAQLPGGKEIQIIKFDAIGAGSDYLSFNLGRSWQKGIPSSKMFSIKVQVVP